MTRILIPRSDNTSAKTIEASDWEKYFCHIRDHKIDGMCLSAQCPNVLAVDVAIGTVKVNGLYLNNSTACDVSCLTAATVAATGTVTIACPIACDTVTVNGLVYTGVVGCKANNTQFTICGTNCAIATDLACSVTADTRCGTLNDVTGAACAAVVTLTTSVAGTVGNATTLVSSCGTTLAVSGATFSGGLDQTNYIYTTICRDPTCEPQGWIFSKNTTGVTPVDSYLIGTAVTTATNIASVCNTPCTSNDGIALGDLVVCSIVLPFSNNICEYSNGCETWPAISSSCACNFKKITSAYTGTAQVELYEQQGNPHTQGSGISICSTTSPIYNRDPKGLEFKVWQQNSPGACVTWDIVKSNVCAGPCGYIVEETVACGLVQCLSTTVGTLETFLTSPMSTGPLQLCDAYFWRISSSGSANTYARNYRSSSDTCGWLAANGIRSIYAYGDSTTPENQRVNWSVNGFSVLLDGAENALMSCACTTWTSCSETNPWMYLDMTTCTIVSAIAMDICSTCTTETEIKIQTSTNATCWNDKRTITVSDLSGTGWNYIRFNTETTRYIRIYGNSGTSKVLAINEIKLLTNVTNDIYKHGHKYIDPTDTSLSLSGN